MQCHAIVSAVIAYSAAISVCEKGCSTSKPYYYCAGCVRLTMVAACC